MRAEGGLLNKRHHIWTGNTLGTVGTRGVISEWRSQQEGG